MKTLLRLEELALFLLSLYLFGSLSYAWWLFPLLLFVPDISMAGYLLGNRAGAVLYNLFHHRGISLALYLAGTALSHPALSLGGLILFAHSTLDRIMGYGLKHYGGFEFTSLGKIGRDRADLTR